MDENCEKIKAVLEDLSTASISSTARLIAILEAIGIEDREEVERLTNSKASTVREGRRALKIQRQKSITAGNPAPEIQRCDGNPAQTMEIQRQKSSVPSRAHAMKELPSEVLFTEEEEKKERTPLTPQGGNVLTVSNWNEQFADQHSGGVIQNPDGSIDLVNGTRAMWLEQFGGDEARLKLAIIQAAGEVQPRSRQPLRLQIERSLARIAGQKHDSDQRYKSRIQTNPPKQASASEFSRLLAERQARKAAEGAA